MTSRKLAAVATTLALGLAATAVFAGEDDLTLESYLATAKSAPSQTASAGPRAVNGEHDTWLEGLCAKYAFRNGTLTRVDPYSNTPRVVVDAREVQRHEASFDDRVVRAAPPSNTPRQVVDAREVQRHEASFYGAG